MSPATSWLTVVCVLLVGVLLGLLLERMRPRPSEFAAPAPAGPGVVRRRDWLLEQLDDPELPVERRVALNEELRHLTPAPFDWLHDELREAASQ